MIITVNTNEKKALSKLTNSYADLAFTVMDLAGCSPKEVTRETAMEELVKDIQKGGKIQIVNESTVIVDEEMLVGVAKYSQATVNLLKRLAPLLVPVAISVTPIIKEYLKELEEIDNPPKPEPVVEEVKSEFTCNDHDQHEESEFNANDFISHGKVERKN